jgi:hypothetical protein
MTTSAEWIRAFSEVTLSPYITALNIARALRDAGLFVKPSRGQGHKKTSVTASDLANYLMAQASLHTKDVAEVVTRLRRMPFLGSNPFFGDGNFGSAFDQMIEGQHPPSADISFFLRTISLSTQPYRGDLVWVNQDGSLVRTETYAETEPEGKASQYSIIKKTYIDSHMIMFAAQMLKKSSDAKAAVPGRTAARVEQPTDEHPKTPARRTVRNNSVPTRARARLQRLTRKKD